MIPLNNSLDKVEAFIPSVTKKYRDSQRVHTPNTYIETLDVLSNLQKLGWELKEGSSIISKHNRKPTSHQIKLIHPDLVINESQEKKIKALNKTFASISLINSCNGLSPLKLDIGSYRQICSNGLWGWGSKHNISVKHNQDGKNKLYFALKEINEISYNLINGFKQFQNITLSKEKIDEIISNAIKIRFGNNSNIDENQLLQIHRKADNGNDLWSVFNRVQENLTNKPLIVNENGRLVTANRVTDPIENIRINSQLTKLVMNYA